jgi:hypothetical protein
VAGLIAAVATVAAEGRLGPRDPRATDPTSWWGILPPVPPTSITRGTLAGISALSVAALCVCWIVLVRLALTGRLRPRAALAATVVWATPFAVGPPLFSRDAYAYAAQGELARRGIDPATHGVAALAGDSSGAAFMSAVDPRWRDTHTPYGGGAVAVERFAAAVAHAVGAGPTMALVTLRILAVVAVAVLVACTWRLATAATGGSATVAVALVGANPVTLIHLVGGMHLDALVTAALAGGLLLERRHGTAGRTGSRAGTSRFWKGISFAGVAATALACFAGTVKVTAFLGLVWVLVAHARRARTVAGRAAMAGTLAVDLAVALAVLGLSMLASGFGPTWLHALSTSGALTTGVAPASVLAALLAALARLGGVHASTGSGSVLLTGARVAALAVAALVCARLLWLAWRRPARPGRSGAAGLGPAEDVCHDGLLVLGLGGLAVALGSPVLYPWYLAPTLPMLGVLAAGWHLAHLEAGACASSLAHDCAGAGDEAARARRRCRVVVGVVVAGSIWLCGATLSPLAQTWRLLAPDGPAGTLPLVVTAVAGAILLIIAATVATRTVSRPDRPGRPDPSALDAADDERRAATR